MAHQPFCHFQSNGSTIQPIADRDHAFPKNLYEREPHRAKGVRTR